MNLQCDSIRKLFDEYINDTLPNKQKKLISDHLKNCNDCRKEYNKELKIIKTMNDMPLFPCPEKVVQKIESQTYKKYAEKPVLNKIFHWIFINKVRPVTIGLAAVVLAVVILIPIFHVNDSRKDSAETMYSSEEVQKAQKEAELSLAYIGHIINENRKEAVNNVLLDRFPKIIRESLKNSINIIGGE